jgi:predicted amidohydrolase
MPTQSGRYVAAAVNFRSAFCRPRENVERIVSFIDEAVRQRPATRLAVFPECATTGLPGSAADRPGSEIAQRFVEVAELVPGYTSATLGGAARRHGLYVAAGFVERDSRRNGVIYNSSLLIGPTGDVVAVHRKVHTGGIFTPGNEIRVVHTAIGRLGLSICYDLWFPEFLRLQVLQGCQVHINLTANQPIFAIGSTYFPVVRAAESGVYVVSANRVGDDRPAGGLEYMGASSVVAPMGEVLSVAGRANEEIIYGDIDLARIDQTQAMLPTLRSRRTDLYDIVAHERAAAADGISRSPGQPANRAPMDH